MPDSLSASDLEAVRAAVAVLRTMPDFGYVDTEMTPEIWASIASLLNAAPALLAMAEAAAGHADESGSSRCSCR